MRGGGDSTHSIPYRFVSTCPRPRGYIPGACMLDVWKPVPGSFRPASSLVQSRAHNTHAVTVNTTTPDRHESLHATRPRAPLPRRCRAPLPRSHAPKSPQHFYSQ